MKLKIDLHVHSEYSIDSINKIDTIIKKCLEKKIDGFALTDHDSIEGLDKIINKKDVIIIPGIEVTAKDAHILGLNLTKKIEPGLTISKTVDEIHSHGGLAILAHPYSFPKSWININKISNIQFDAVETKNASQIPFKLMEKYSNKLAKTLKLPKTAGSDSHIPITVGKAYTIIDSESKKIPDIIDAIKEGKTEPIGNGITLNERIYKLIQRFRKN
ncbi:PHP domain-containing protein [Candidatus Bathyarchaeota archaeon]|nr:PHP domain-containing protein [Candidatus Bathyarchaeota archaeon]